MTPEERGRTDVMLGVEEMRRAVLLMLDGFKYQAMRDPSWLGPVCMQIADNLYDSVKLLNPLKEKEATPAPDGPDGARP